MGVRYGDGVAGVFGEVVKYAIFAVATHGFPLPYRVTEQGVDGTDACCGDGIARAGWVVMGMCGAGEHAVGGVDVSQPVEVVDVGVAVGFDNPVVVGAGKDVGVCASHAEYAVQAVEVTAAVECGRDVMGVLRDVGDGAGGVICEVYVYSVAVSSQVWYGAE